jgi:hypothetical protein
MLAVGLVSFGVVGVAGLTQAMGSPQISGVPQVSGAQQGVGQVGQSPTVDPYTKDKGDDFPTRSMSQKQQKWRNEERQQRLVADTNKLLTLATQLHEDVTKTDKNILSVDVVRRADEIEKLAHGVKEREKE